MGAYEFCGERGSDAADFSGVVHTEHYELTKFENITLLCLFVFSRYYFNSLVFPPIYTKIVYLNVSLKQKNLVKLLFFKEMLLALLLVCHIGRRRHRTVGPIPLPVQIPLPTPPVPRQR